MTSIELKSWLEKVAIIIKGLHISVNNVNRLCEEKYENESIVKGHGFFRHYYSQLWFIITVQLSKLLSKSPNQKLNLNKLLQQLESEKLDKSITDLLSLNKLGIFTNTFKDKNDLIKNIANSKNKIDAHQIIIKKILTARNTIYAHSDPNAKPQDINLDEVNKLVLLCTEIFASLRSGIFDNHIDFNRPNDWSVDYLLKESSLGRTLRHRKK